MDHTGCGRGVDPVWADSIIDGQAAQCLELMRVSFRGTIALWSGLKYPYQIHFIHILHIFVTCMFAKQDR